jgi:membrane-bound metal-dependent hydrolase YbcI (DUF457 family)
MRFSKKQSELCSGRCGDEGTKMTVLDHVALGGLAGLVGAPGQRKTLVAIGMATSILPDVDMAWSGPPGTLGYLEYHRLGTHSLLALPLYALIAMGLLFLWNRYRQPLVKISYLRVAVVGMLAYASHVFLDVLPPYGIPLLWPLTGSKYSLQVLHDFDPAMLVISATVVVGVALETRRPGSASRRVVLAGMMFYLIYGGFAIVSMEKMRGAVREVLSEERHHAKIDMIPRTWWRWKAVVDTGNDWRVFTENGDARKEQRFQKPRHVLPASLLREKVISRYLDFALYPVVLKYDGQSLALSNLSYSPKNYRLDVTLTTDGRTDAYTMTSFDLEDQE